MVCANTLNS